MMTALKCKVVSRIILDHLEINHHAVTSASIKIIQCCCLIFFVYYVS